MKIEKLRRYARWQPQLYEVWAPEGRRFGTGEHSRIVTSFREAQRVVREEAVELEPCPPDCECGE